MRFGFDEISSSSEDSDSVPSVIIPSPPSQVLRPITKRLTRPIPISKSKIPPTPKSKPPLPISKLNPTKFNPPKLKAKRGRILPVSYGYSDEENLVEDDSDDDDDEGEDDDDSEEEEWPVGPIGSVGLGGWRRGNGKGKGRASDQNNAENTRLFGGTDVWELWDEKEKASSWVTANRSFHLSLSKSLSASSSSTTFSTAIPSDVGAIQTLLASLALAQTKSQSDLVASFESRNAALWNSIESSILEAEKQEGEKQRLMEENRKRGEEAERKAKEMRENEVLKLKLEEKKREEGKVAAMKKLEENKRLEEEERVKAIAVAAAAAKAAKAVGTADEGTPQFEWERWTAKMQYIKQTVLPLISGNREYRSACFVAKRAITPKIGQLTASASQISSIITQLDQILNSVRPKAQGAPIESYIWVLNHLSKALVKQSEQEVTAKLGTAYPLGKVVIGLLGRGHVDLGEVLMARLVKKCFWITGYWPPKRPGQVDEEYQKSLGHAPPSKSESLTQYSTRMSGLVALYSSILQTSPLVAPQGPIPSNSLINIPSHFRPSAAWSFLTHLLLPPLVGLEPTPLLLITFLEIASRHLRNIYGRQWDKFLEVLLREGLRENKAGFSDKSRSSSVRLLLWLEEWESKGVMECPEGWD